jgi:hypothetical protein
MTIGGTPFDPPLGRNTAIAQKPDQFDTFDNPTSLKIPFDQPMIVVIGRSGGLIQEPRARHPMFGSWRKLISRKALAQLILE